MKDVAGEKMKLTLVKFSVSGAGNICALHGSSFLPDRFLPGDLRMGRVDYF